MGIGSMVLKGAAVTAGSVGFAQGVAALSKHTSPVDALPQGFATLAAFIAFNILLAIDPYGESPELATCIAAFAACGLVKAFILYHTKNKSDNLMNQLMVTGSAIPADQFSLGN
jgi:hypothetical protein